MKCVLTICCLLSLSSVAHGYFIEGATGHEPTTEKDTGEAGGQVWNWAALDRTEGRFGDTWGTGLDYFNYQFVPGTDAFGNRSGGLDTRARYLYLYQVTSYSTELSIRHASLPVLVNLREITSWGYFSDASFADNDDLDEEIEAVSFENDLGVTTTREPGVTVRKVYEPTVVLVESTEEYPYVSPDEVLLTRDAFRASFGDERVPPLGASVIFGLTSNRPPVAAGGVIIRGVTDH